MVRAFIHNEMRHSPPPNRGMALGWRLALSTSLIVGLVMAVISLGQQFFELKQQRQLHQRLLALSMIPLVARIEAAEDLSFIEHEVEDFHKAYITKGFHIHEILLLDSADKTVLSTGELRQDEHGIGRLQARIPLNSSLLDGGQGLLAVSISNRDYQNIISRNWWPWSLHFVVTLGAVFFFLYVAIYFQVTKPVSGLVQIVKKMERGYWGPVDMTGGAWEIRWLAWRFGNMVHEMKRTMTQLLEAQQKARLPVSAALLGDEATDKKHRTASIVVAPDHTEHPAYHRLLAACRQLEAMSLDDPKAVEVSRQVWQREAVEANRLDFQEIKARLENAALRLMEPETYRRLKDDLGELTVSRQDWTNRCGDKLYRLLEAAAIPCAGVLHRVKHTAGVWEKMQSKGLKMREIHDLFAFRIIVPTKADCYAALGVIHNEYDPLITRFKDYIAEPKENGYRSLHTCVTNDDGLVFEIQIRSIMMDRQSEHGNAAHWAYKEDRRQTKYRSVFQRWSHRLLQRTGD